MQDKFGLRLAPGRRDQNEGEDGYEGRSGISHGPPSTTGYHGGRPG